MNCLLTTVNEASLSGMSIRRYVRYHAGFEGCLATMQQTLETCTWRYFKSFAYIEALLKPKYKLVNLPDELDDLKSYIYAAVESGLP
ncbi:hypothetical protein K470DRAFT_256551 [Piedraia hortae CBS 480.64]|uniref:Uncharacterized protein n=1 Tax=Piedraia hortae CBS 480.64 TaxID=1314780 RepID=A0A6A7C291_9PEZI|nr:hypothetical protein K470DRAFT_256551 [Piedraia hortae CBS 480.64]